MYNPLFEALEHILGVRDKIRAGGTIENVKASYDMNLPIDGLDINDPIFYEIGFEGHEQWLKSDFVGLKISWRMLEELIRLYKEKES